jgi:LysM repeat protein
MECPVCKTPGLDPEVKICPHCFSDLEAFGYTKCLAKTLKTSFWAMMIALLLIVFLVLAWIFIPLTSHPLRTASEKELLNKQVQELILTNKQLQLTISNLESEKLETDSLVQAMNIEMTALRTSKGRIVSGEGEYTEYTVTWGESLYLIAQKVYEDGKLYVRIARDNAIKDPDKILEGQKLKIYK